MSFSPEPLSSVSLNLLLFSIGGAWFGVDVDQIEEMSAYSGKEAEELFWFHATLGIDGEKIPHKTAVVVTIKTGEPLKNRVIIDTLEDLVQIGIDEIRPFPPIMASFVMRKGMWGVVLRGGIKILLVDFLYLLRQRAAIKDHGERGGP